MRVELKFNDSIAGKFIGKLRSDTWMPSDDSMLLLLDELGMDAAQIAQHLSYRSRCSRTEGAVKTRLRQLAGAVLDVEFKLSK